jgi:hypothetical protein
MLLQSIGCGAEVSGDTWLITAGGDTASVSEVGAAWSRLDDAERELFTAKDNALGQFLLAYARKMMLELEVDSRGLMSDPDMIACGEVWFRYTIGAEAIDSLRSSERLLITDEEVRFFLDHAGRWVWYTLRPGEPAEEIRGPEHLPEIYTPGLAAHLDTMSVGQILTDAGGVSVRLDSIQLADSAMIGQILADTTTSREMAIESIMVTRAAIRMEQILDVMHMEHSVHVDTAAVERLAAFYNGEAELLDETLFTSDLDNWTSQQLSNELAFLSSKDYTQPSSSSWLLYCLDNMLMQTILIEQQGISSARLDSLRADAEAYMFDLALEWLYDEMVSSSVQVTEEDVQYQFEFLTEPVMLPEQRVLRVALLPSQRADDYRTAAAAGTLDRFLDELDGMPALTASPTDDLQRTRPLTVDEVPGDYGDLVFDGSDADTTGWMGPYRLGDSGDYILFRVEEILPAAEAGLEEIRSQVEIAARERLEDEATVHWMQHLEEEYSLDINEEALDRLPADPAQWCDL